MGAHRKLLATSLAAVTITLGAALPASADRGGRPPTVSAPIATGLLGPLQMAVKDDTAYVAQTFIGVLTAIDEDGQRRDVAANPGNELAGVDVAGGSIWYTTTDGSPVEGTTTATTLTRVSRGQKTVVADLLTYERTVNPDRNVQYGFQSIPDSCAAQWPVDQVGPPQYTGLVDSHPYAVAVRGGTAYVAEAGGNAILAVDRGGNIRTVAVLPPQPLQLSADALAANGLPTCAAGLTYDFEAVPTDVEIADDGTLFVTTLPGGPESPALGARGSVYRVNPRTGATTRVATGFAGAVNLALGDGRAIYVSELFGNRVSKVVNGGPQTVVSLSSPSALEYSDGKLWVAYDSLPAPNQPPDGKVATISLRG